MDASFDIICGDLTGNSAPQRLLVISTVPRLSVMAILHTTLNLQESRPKVMSRVPLDHIHAGPGSASHTGCGPH